MLGSRQIREVIDLGAEVDVFRGRCERLSDAFAGVGLVFAMAGALVLVVGVGLRAPQFAASAGFALVASAAFAIAARKLTEARRDLPRIQPLAPQLAGRLRAAARWRRAA